MYLFVNEGDEQELIRESVLPDDTCQTKDSIPAPNSVSSAALHFCHLLNLEKKAEEINQLTLLTVFNHCMLQLVHMLRWLL